MSLKESRLEIGNLFAAAGLIALGVWKRILQPHFVSDPSLPEDILGFLLTLLLVTLILSVAIFVLNKFSEGGWRYLLEEWTWTVLGMGAGAAFVLLLPLTAGTRVGLGILAVVIGLVADDFLFPPHVVSNGNSELALEENDSETGHEELDSYLAVADSWHEDHQYKRERYRSTLVLNEDGTGIIFRQIYGFKSRSYEPRKRIEKHMKFNYPEAVIDDFTVDPIDDDHSFAPEDDIRIEDTIIHGHFTIPGPLAADDTFSWKTTLRFERLFAMSWEESTEIYTDRDWQGPCHVLGMRYPTDQLIVRVIFPDSWSPHWDHVDPSLFVGWEWSDEQHEARSRMSDNFLRWEEGIGFSSLSAECPDWAREELERLEQYLGNRGDGNRPWAMAIIRKPWPQFMFGVCWKPPRRLETVQS